MSLSIKDTAQMFVDGWVSGDLKKSFEYTQLTWRQGKDLQNLATVLHRYVPAAQLGFYIVEENEVRADVRIKVHTSGGDITLQARLIREAGPFRVSDSGRWGVNPASIHQVKE